MCLMSLCSRHAGAPTVGPKRGCCRAVGVGSRDGRVMMHPTDAVHVLTGAALRFCVTCEKRKLEMLELERKGQQSVVWEFNGNKPHAPAHNTEQLSLTPKLTTTTAKKLRFTNVRLCCGDSTAATGPQCTLHFPGEKPESTKGALNQTAAL